MMKTRSPWFWVPTLYFAQGIPYFIVNNISVMMFTKMGVPNGEMALFTSLLYLPWSFKPFWSPFVDIIKTKRWWTIVGGDGFFTDFDNAHFSCDFSLDLHLQDGSCFDLR